MATSALLLLSLLLPQSSQPTAETLPAFDLAFAEADLVVIATPKGYAGDHIPITIHTTLKGRTDGPRIFVLQPRGYGLHVRLPANATPHLIFLHKSRSGWIPLQRSGILIPVPAKSRREQALRAFVGLLRRKQSTDLARDFCLYATSHIQADPLLAQAALLTLARRPALAPDLGPKERQQLRTLLLDERSAVVLRDLSARVLWSAKDPGLDNRMIALLSQGKATGLGPVFGRLLASPPTPASLAGISNAWRRASEQTRPEILASLQAFPQAVRKKLENSLK